MNYAALGVITLLALTILIPLAIMSMDDAKQQDDAEKCINQINSETFWKAMEQYVYSALSDTPQTETEITKKVRKLAPKNLGITYIEVGVVLTVLTTHKKIERIDMRYVYKDGHTENVSTYKLKASE